MVHMVRIMAGVSTTSSPPTADAAAAVAAVVVGDIPSVFSICVKRAWTIRVKSASLSTTLKPPIVFPARFRTTKLLLPNWVRHICRMGSCCRVTLSAVAPNRANRSVRISKQERIISFCLARRMPSRRRPTLVRDKNKQRRDESVREKYCMGLQF